MKGPLRSLTRLILLPCLLTAGGTLFAQDPPTPGPPQHPGIAQNPGIPQHPGIAQTPGIPQTRETQQAIAVATGFMNALIRDSSIGNLLPLCGLPFCHDDSVIITTRAELERALNQLVAAAARDRARSHPRIDSAYVLNIRKGAMFGMVPMNIYFTVVQLRFTVRGQEASRLFILAVQLTDDAKVVGIEE